MKLHRPGTWIHYETQGQGPPVVLIHAISTGSRMWTRQVEAFTDHARVITLDARGVGRSGNLTGPRHIRDQISDDIAALLDELGEESAFICGVSFGGVIAQHFAATHPHRVEALMVVDSYGDSRPLSLSRAAWLASVYAGSVSNFLPRTLLTGLMQQAYRQWPEAAAHLADAVRSLRPWQAFYTRNAINLVNYLPAITLANYPVWFVLGEDSWWRSERFATEFAAAVPRAKLIRVPDSADPTPLCQPETFNDILRNALIETGHVKND